LQTGFFDGLEGKDHLPGLVDEFDVELGRLWYRWGFEAKLESDALLFTSAQLSSPIVEGALQSCQFFLRRIDHGIVVGEGTEPGFGRRTAGDGGGATVTETRTSKPVAHRLKSLRQDVADRWRAKRAPVLRSVVGGEDVGHVGTHRVRHRLLELPELLEHGLSTGDGMPASDWLGCVRLEHRHELTTVGESGRQIGESSPDRPLVAERDASEPGPLLSKPVEGGIPRKRQHGEVPRANVVEPSAILDEPIAEESRRCLGLVLGGGKQEDGRSIRTPPQHPSGSGLLEEIPERPDVGGERMLSHLGRFARGGWISSGARLRVFSPQIETTVGSVAEM
jgi:hypothetical protein